MAFFCVNKIHFAGLAACVPANTFSNHQYNWLTERERSLLIKTTGIEYRRVVSDNCCASDLCYTAAEKLMAALNWQKSDIGLLIFVSQTPDYITPCTAVILQERLGLPSTCLAFDINLGCSAYVYGLSVAGSLLANMPGKKGLLLVGDALSKFISEKDKSVAPLFSDAGTATALDYNPLAQPMYFNLQSDGKGYNAIMIQDGGSRHPLNVHSLEETEREKGIVRSNAQMQLNGTEVFNFGLREVAPNIETLLQNMGKTTASFDYVVFHQANLLMNERIRNKLQLEREKVPYSLKNYDNTSNATIPLTMVAELGAELQNRPLSLLLSGFGVGLSWGSAAICTEPLVCLPVIEI